MSAESKAHPKCGGGDPCVYMGKDVGWILYEPELETVNGTPYPPTSLSYLHDNTTIFYTMASYRDKLCPVTLFNLFTKAKNPARITVGVVQQNMPEDMDCLDEYCRLMSQAGKGDENYCPYREQVTMKRFYARIAKGPTWARAHGSTMVKDEEFCMQTDSHMDFVQNWDSEMLKMWGSTNNEYAVLSTYVTAIEELPHLGEGQKGLNGLHEVPHLCMVTLGGAHGLVRNWGTKCARMLPRPKLTNAIWGAGLSFSKCHAERKVPYDPHTPHIFDGEEFSRSVRLFTWGYDIYTPNRVYVVHNYLISQSDSKHMDWWGNGVNVTEGDPTTSANRLKLLLGMTLTGVSEQNDSKYDREFGLDAMKVRKSKYGLGDRRTLRQAIEFSGVDTIDRKILGNRCGNIAYVPFKEHPLGPEYIPKYNPVTEEFEDVRDPYSIYFNHSNPADMHKWNTFVTGGRVDKERKEGTDAAASLPMSHDQDVADFSGFVHKIEADIELEVAAGKAFISTHVYLSALLLLFSLFFVYVLKVLRRKGFVNCFRLSKSPNWTK